MLLEFGTGKKTGQQRSLTIPTREVTGTTEILSLNLNLKIIMSSYDFQVKELRVLEFVNS